MEPMHIFSEKALAMHNFYRFKHSASPLSLCPLLQQSAQKWAEKLITQPGLSNSPEAKSGTVGENLFRKVTTGSTKPPKNKPVVTLAPGAAPPPPKVKAPTSAKEVVDYWYNHHGKYDWKNGNGLEAGAFTQVVWKRSREVGFGVARSGDQVVVVAHYSPPGNIAGHYAANVTASSEVFDTMSGRKRHTEILLYRASTGVVTVKKTSKEYIDKQGNFVRTTKFVMGKPGCGPPTQNKHIRAKSSEKKDKSAKGPGDKAMNVKPSNPAGGATAGTKTKKPGRHTDSSSSSSSSSDDESVNSKKGLEGFRKEVLELHNKQRKTHNCPDLLPNRELDLLAQKWARKLSKMDKLVSSNARYKNDMLGENIASRRSNLTCDYSAKELVQHWYDEHGKYDYGREPQTIEGVGNFTQMVWRGSKELGVGKYIHRDAHGSKAVVVCYYYPAGNIKTQFIENVYPIKK